MTSRNTNTVTDTDIKASVVFTMRMPPELYEQIKESAGVNKRSIAKEIEFGLEQYLKK